MIAKQERDMAKDWTDIVRESLQEGEAALPEGGFDLFEARYVSAIKRVRRTRVIFVVSALSAAAALLLFFLPSRYHEPVNPAFKPVAGVVPPGVDLPLAEGSQEAVDAALSNVGGQRSRAYTAQKLSQTPRQEPLADGRDVVLSPEFADEDKAEPVSVTEVEVSDLEVAEEPEAPGKAASGLETKPDVFWTEDPFAVEEKPSGGRRGRFSVAASGGLLAQGGGSGNSAVRYSFAPQASYDYNGLSYATPGYAEMINRSLYNVSHHPPVELGVSLRYWLGDHFALRTGLDYTRLSSTYELSSSSGSSKKQVLHFVGIPLAAEFVSGIRGGVSVYGGAGVLAEKCLHASIDEERFKEKGLQFSLSLTAGAECALWRDFALFLEPEARYYLTETSAPTYRTGKSMIFTVRGGIRINLK